MWYTLPALPLWKMQLFTMLCFAVLQYLWPEKNLFANVSDLKAQPFYRFLRRTYWKHVLAQFIVLYLLGGFPWVLWLGVVRIVAIYNTTFAVNSAAHIWGVQNYHTGDLSKNCLWIALLSLGVSSCCWAVLPCHGCLELCLMLQGSSC